MSRLFRRAFRAVSCCVLLPVISSGASIAAESNSGPAEFGTLAMPVSRTSLDHQWQRAFRSDSSVLLPVVRAALGRERMDQLAFVNARVNRLVNFRDDWSAWGTPDRWSTSAETLARGSGDCEDIAIVKLNALQALGVAPEDLYLTVGSLGSRAHALLLVRVEGRIRVLDNLTDRIGSPDEYDEFAPMLTFSPVGRWVHAYARGTPMPHGANRVDFAVGGSALAATIAAQSRNDR